VGIGGLSIDKGMDGFGDANDIDHHSLPRFELSSSRCITMGEGHIDGGG
jgi:hypothetical protein